MLALCISLDHTGSGPFLGIYSSLIRSGRPSFRDFEKIFRCAEEGHFKGQISQKWTNSAKFHVFSSPLLTKMSLFTPKMRDERGIFPKESLLFASTPAGEGCKSPIEGREEIRVRPNGGIVVRQVENDLFFAKKIAKKCPIELQKCGENLVSEGQNYAQFSRLKMAYCPSLRQICLDRIPSKSGRPP